MPLYRRSCFESNDQDRLREHRRCGANGGRLARLHADVRNECTRRNACAQVRGRKDRHLGRHAGEVTARWYQAFPQDVSDNKDYGPLQVPVLVMGGPAYKWMKMVVGEKAINMSAVDVENSVH
ncbi:hypothetical protein PQR02_08020 [Paraburkholderia sediminicola]|uniref:Uncharacterized protein n=1 Tax=Paraburkholderia rhynchosiae TaxID=487049 RepID=A0ACC7N9P1_9BURK